MCKNIRKNPGGVSEVWANNSQYPYMQLFIFMKVPENTVPEEYNKKIIGNIHHYFTSKHFVETYLFDKTRLWETDF